MPNAHYGIQPAKGRALDDYGTLLDVERESMGWGFEFLFAWYDLWVGFYWDRKARKLYFLPLPMIGCVIQFPKRESDADFRKRMNSVLMARSIDLR